jgi:hypothetical protein
VTRTLYLGHDARAVRLDGPSLLVDASDRAESRIPLRLLARVVARTSADWSTDALTNCLGAGIPITFLRPDGSPLGYCLPAARRVADLGRLLEITERRWDGPEGFGNWRAAEQRRAILRLAAIAGSHHSVPDARPDRLREKILAAAGAERPFVAATLLALEGLLSAHLPQILLSAGLPPRWASPAYPGRMDLFAACFDANRWNLIPVLDRLLQHRRRHPDAWRRPRDRQERMARAYEAHSASIEALVKAQLRRLEFLLWENAE